VGTDVRIEQLKNASALETRSFHLDLVTPLFVHGWHKAGDNNKRIQSLLNGEFHLGGGSCVTGGGHCKPMTPRR